MGRGEPVEEGAERVEQPGPFRTDAAGRAPVVECGVEFGQQVDQVAGEVIGRDRAVREKRAQHLDEWLQWHHRVVVAAAEQHHRTLAVSERGHLFSEACLADSARPERP